jgi:hypothetical protein
MDLNNYLTPVTPDPTLFVFLEKVKGFQIDTYVKIQSLHLVAKIHNKHINDRQKFINNMTKRANNKITMERLIFKNKNFIFKN